MKIYNKNPIKEFNNLPNNAKNVCFLYGKNKSILAWNPIAIFSSHDDIDKFRKFVKKNKTKKLIGFLGYDLAYKLYNIKQTAKNDLKLPNIYFLAFDQWKEFGKSNEKIFINNNSYKSKNFKTTINKKIYNDSFKKIQNHIKAGDIYQINLTHRLEATTTIPARTLFTKIITTNDVETFTYIEGDNFEILSASPEKFIKIKNNKIETCPIKGTRPRGINKKEDKLLEKELINSEKEIAELNMITDLLRNDIGKISKTGSVKLKENRSISKHSKVWHTYSKITGELAIPPIEALISMLPGGSITGCPKKRAIEIIDKLELVTRGVYTGVIGQINNQGKELDFNIAIRTIIKKNDKLYLQVGGGIVIDSNQKSEFEETLHKAASFMKIL